MDICSKPKDSVGCVSHSFCKHKCTPPLLLEWFDWVHRGYKWNLDVYQSGLFTIFISAHRKYLGTDTSSVSPSIRDTRATLSLVWKERKKERYLIWGSQKKSKIDQRKSKIKTTPPPQMINDRLLRAMCQCKLTDRTILFPQSLIFEVTRLVCE